MNGHTVTSVERKHAVDAQEGRSAFAGVATAYEPGSPWAAGDSRGTRYPGEWAGLTSGVVANAVPVLAAENSIYGAFDDHVNRAGGRLTRRRDPRSAGSWRSGREEGLEAISPIVLC